MNCLFISVCLCVCLSPCVCVCVSPCVNPHTVLFSCSPLPVSCRVSCCQGYCCPASSSKCRAIFVPLCPYTTHLLAAQWMVFAVLNLPVTSTYVRTYIINFHPLWVKSGHRILINCLFYCGWCNAFIICWWRVWDEREIWVWWQRVQSIKQDFAGTTNIRMYTFTCM